MASEMVTASSGRGMAMPVIGPAYVQQKGDSLAPKIQPGQWVEIDPNVTAFNGPGIYLTDWSDFKPKPHCPRRVPQLRNLDYIDGALHSVPANSWYPPFKVALSDLLIGGKAVER